MEFLGTEALKPACERIASVGALPQLALMLSYEDRQPLLPFDGASVSGSQTVQWIACNSSKPGRDGAGDAAAGSSASGGAQGAVKIPAAGASSGMQSWVVLSTIEFAQARCTAWQASYAIALLEWRETREKRAAFV